MMHNPFLALLASCVVISLGLQLLSVFQSIEIVHFSVGRAKISRCSVICPFYKLCPLQLLGALKCSCSLIAAVFELMLCVCICIYDDG